MVRNMEWAAQSNHMGGIPRKAVLMAVAAFSKAVATFFNTTVVYNADKLTHLVLSRPPGVPLITVSNHMSTLDDPVMWGFNGFNIEDANLARWVLAAEDICFKNKVLSYFFRLGKCIPITRGAGIYQEYMNEALDRLREGAWLHTFPEGKVFQEDLPIKRLKWGTASLIARASITPIVLPIVHSGLEKVMPERVGYGRRPVLPLMKKKIRTVIGEPMEFDIAALSRRAAVAADSGRGCDSSCALLGWPKSGRAGLGECAQKWLYSFISHQIRESMEDLRCRLRNLH